MPVLSPKRQVTLPKELCDRLHVRPGDEIDFVESEGRITIVKKRMGASYGVLKHLKANKQHTDEDSLLSTVTRRQSSAKSKRRAA